MTIKKRSFTDPRRVGGRYYCGYWRREYTVLAIAVNGYGRRSFTVEWDDGTQTSHGTAWHDVADRIVEEVAVP